MIRILLAVTLLFSICQSVNAAPISSLPGLTQVVINEQTGGISTYSYDPNAAALTTMLADPLGAGNNDFTGTSIEYYDVFYSDSNGSFNIDGEYLTITALFNNAGDSALNINRVFLEFSDKPTAFATEVASFVSNGLYISLTELNALGDTLGTTTLLGHTAGQPESFRLSLTLGFDATNVGVIPVPAAVWLFGTALIGLAGISRRRKVA